MKEKNQLTDEVPVSLSRSLLPTPSVLLLSSLEGLCSETNREQAQTTFLINRASVCLYCIRCRAAGCEGCEGTSVLPPPPLPPGAPPHSRQTHSTACNIFESPPCDCMLTSSSRAIIIFREARMNVLFSPIQCGVALSPRHWNGWTGASARYTVGKQALVESLLPTRQWRPNTPPQHPPSS